MPEELSTHIFVVKVRGDEMVIVCRKEAGTHMSRHQGHMCRAR